MRVLWFLSAILVVATAAGQPTAMAGRSRSQQAERAQTVWDGVYTTAQAARGGSVYRWECAFCHGEDLRGEGFAPALVADVFTDRWRGYTVADLFTVIKVTMPADRPDTLRDEAYVALVAYLLKANDYPVSQVALSTDPSQLQHIKFSSR